MVISLVTFSVTLPRIFLFSCFVTSIVPSSSPIYIDTSLSTQRCFRISFQILCEFRIFSLTLKSTTSRIILQFFSFSTIRFSGFLSFWIFSQLKFFLCSRFSSSRIETFSQSSLIFTSSIFSLFSLSKFFSIFLSLVSSQLWCSISTLFLMF